MEIMNKISLIIINFILIQQMENVFGQKSEASLFPILSSCNLLHRNYNNELIGNIDDCGDEFFQTAISTTTGQDSAESFCILSSLGRISMQKTLLLYNLNSICLNSSLNEIYFSNKEQTHYFRNKKEGGITLFKTSCHCSESGNILNFELKYIKRILHLFDKTKINKHE